MTVYYSAVGDLIPEDAPIYACGEKVEGGMCAQHLRHLSPQMPNTSYRAWCDVHGVVPLFALAAEHHVAEEIKCP